jgi:hypothetical protein
MVVVFVQRSLPREVNALAGTGGGSLSGFFATVESLKSGVRLSSIDEVYELLRSIETQ